MLCRERAKYKPGFSCMDKQKLMKHSFQTGLKIKHKIRNLEG